MPCMGACERLNRTAMSKWIAVHVEDATHEAYQDEAIRLTRKTGSKVTLAQVVKAELSRGEQRLRNKAKS